MATIKVKLRPSRVDGRAGMVFYQVTHRRMTQQIKTGIRLQPECWDAYREKVAIDVAGGQVIQHRIDSDVAFLKKENVQDGVICYARRKTMQLEYYR